MRSACTNKACPVPLGHPGCVEVDRELRGSCHDCMSHYCAEYCCVGCHCVGRNYVGAAVSHKGVGTAVRDVAVGVSTMWDIAVKDIVVQDTAVENTVGCYCRFLWCVSLLCGTWWDM